MSNDYLNLDDMSREVLDILRRFRLDPLAFGVAITLSKEEFEKLAENHPDLVQPDLMLRTKPESDGLQWFIQIQPVMSFPDISTDS